MWWLSSLVVELCVHPIKVINFSNAFINDVGQCRFPIDYSKNPFGLRKRSSALACYYYHYCCYYFRF